MYEIMRQGEVIASTYCRLEAEYLRGKYQIAFSDMSVYIRANETEE